jgi:hypothetical protein
MKLPFKIALIGLGLGLLFDQLFYGANGLGINILIAEMLFLGGSYLAARLGNHVLPRRAYLAAGFALAFAATFAVWTSDYGLAVSFVGFLVANLLFVVFAIGHEARWHHPLEIFFTGTFDLGMRLMSRLNIISHLKPEKVTFRQSSLFRGLIILTPIFLIFVAIFAGADAAFAWYIRNFFEWLETFTDLPRLIQHLILIGFFTVLFTLFFSAAFWERFTIEIKEDLSPRFFTESKVVLTGLVLLFAAFLIIQSRALFGGQAALEAYGLTYSEYARSGFNQLIVAAVLVTGLILTLRLVHGVQADRRLIGLHFALLIETFLVLISAYYRMFMYIDAYGYTPARIFSLAVMDTITILLVLLTYNVAKRQSQAVVMRQGLIVLGVCALLFTMSAPDALSVALNVRQFEKTGKPIDAMQFELLSAEAVPSINKLFAEQLPIEGLLNPQPSLEEYCVVQRNGWLDSTRNEAVLKDLAVRQSLDNWYHNQAQTPWEVDPDWRDWNYSRSQIPTEPYGMIFDSSYSPVPAWVNAPYADDPARLYEVCNAETLQ